MPRTKSRDRDLPPCVYRHHGAIYLVKNNRWIRLGDDLKTALTQYARLITRPTDRMPGLLWRWLDDIEIAAKTRHTYTTAVRKLADILAEFDPEQVTSRDILTILHHHRKTPAMANVMRSVLIGALEFGFREGVVERNVARDVQPLKTARRDRYITHQEFAAIYNKAGPTLQSVMDLCYLTGQRIGDVLGIRLADLTEEGISFRQQKTGHKMIVEWSPDLHAAVARAKAHHQSVRGMTLLHTRKGAPCTYTTVRTLWDRACAAAGVENAHIHDLRAKAATDARKQGLDSQALLGHTTESSHLRYLRGKETSVAQPVQGIIRNRVS